jgi:serine/threonine-protein kinase
MPVERAHPRAGHERRRWLVPALVAAAVIAVIAGIASAMGGVGVSLPSTRPVPGVVGQHLKAARHTLAANGFHLTVNRVDKAATTAGLVLGQSPAPRSTLVKGGLVTLTVASGDVTVARHRYVGKPVATVTRALAALGLTPTTTSTPSATPSGTVLGIAPTGEVAVGSRITVSVAVPKPQPLPVTLPPGKAKKLPGPKGPGPGHGHGHGKEG